MVNRIKTSQKLTGSMEKSVPTSLYKTFSSNGENLLSTNSFVGVYTDTGLTFKAQYCHWDGYPSGVGKALWSNWHSAFNGDTQKLADFVLRSRYGWSVLADTDFTKSPVWWEGHDPEKDEKFKHHPRWYDTRSADFRGMAEYITHNTYQQWIGIEWAYLIDIERDVIDVFKVTLEHELILVGTMLKNTDPDYGEFEDWQK